jgi:hypothetical protein
VSQRKGQKKPLYGFTPDYSYLVVDTCSSTKNDEISICLWNYLYDSSLLAQTAIIFTHNVVSGLFADGGVAQGQVMRKRLFFRPFIIFFLSFFFNGSVV